MEGAMTFTEWAREVFSGDRTENKESPDGSSGPVGHPIDEMPTDDEVDVPDSESGYDVDVDHGRLQRSEAVHADQDHAVIDAVLSTLEDTGLTKPYRVLDAGCGYGTVTIERFGDDERFDVTAIDNSENALQVARSWYNAENIDYQLQDVRYLDQNELGEFDIVFSSYLFHHLGQQQEVLGHLWEHVSDEGALIVRSCDDGQHLHYPRDEQMDWVVNVTDKIPGSSDRTHGRRLPVEMQELDPEPAEIGLHTWNYSTAGCDKEGRVQYWDVFHSNRRHYAERVIDNSTDGDEIELAENLIEAMDELRDKFEEQSGFIDMKTVPMAVAYRSAETSSHDQS